MPVHLEQERQVLTLPVWPRPVRVASSLPVLLARQVPVVEAERVRADSSWEESHRRVLHSCMRGRSSRPDLRLSLCRIA